MRLTFTNEENVKFFKGIVYGPSGVGKTYSVKTIPNLDSVVILSSEAGLLPLRDTKIEVWTLDSWEDVDKARALLRNYADPDTTDEYAIALRKRKKIEKIFIDSATELSKKCMSQVLIDRGIILDKAKKPLGDMFEDQLRQADWGVVKSRVDKMFRDFRDLPFHVVFTALSHNHESDETHTVKTMPLMYPQSLSEQVPGYFDEVFYMYQTVENNVVSRKWQTLDDGKKVAKDRLNVFNSTIDPNWDFVFQALNKGSK